MHVTHLLLTLFGWLAGLVFVFILHRGISDIELRFHFVSLIKSPYVLRMLFTDLEKHLFLGACSSLQPLELLIPPRTL